MVAIEFRKACDNGRIVRMPRPARERNTLSSTWKKLVVGKRKRRTGFRSCSQECRHTRDVRLKRQTDQIIVQLDVLIVWDRKPCRLIHRRYSSKSLFGRLN